MIKTTWRSNLAAAVMACAVAASAQAQDAAVEAAPPEAGPAEGSLAAALKPTFDALSNNGEGYDLGSAIFGPDSAYDIGGWLAAGYSSQSTGLFNADDSVNLTQAWLFVTKSLDASDGFDWGFRVDGMFGSDGPDTQAFGGDFGDYDFTEGAIYNNKYGFAAPQLYVELGYKDFSIKGGHFYTPVGYEVVTAPDNFFYSHALTMYFSEPFTHTGVVGTYSGIDGVSLFAGWTAGWDTGFTQNMGGSSFLGGVSLEPVDWAKITYTAMAGDMGWIGDGYNHSLVIDVAATDKLQYVFQSDYVNLDQKYDALLGDNPEYETIGVNQYLIYTVTDVVSVGGRAEWYRNNETDYYEVTAGVNFDLLPNLVLRPEVRYQFSPEAKDDPNDFLEDSIGVPFDQAAFGFDAILTF
ncbi:MAG: outer membrane beta-barrel protein [Candidatus Binatia bacterium]